MASRARIAFALVALTSFALGGHALLACASDDDDALGSVTPEGDASTTKPDGGSVTPEDAGTEPSDASTKPDSPYTKDCPGTTPQTQPGETCIGFGKSGSTCDKACGRAYGYVCVDGGPPGFSDCVRVSSSFLGESYCCTENKCVAQPDQDKECTGVAGMPHRYQCPIGDDGGALAPPAGCQEKGSGGSSAEKFYCCP